MKKLGRPVGNMGGRYSTLSLRITSALRKEMKMAAEKDGLTMSTWAASVLEDATTRKVSVSIKKIIKYDIPK